MQFRKKPVVIDAFRFTGADSAFALGEWWRSFGPVDTQAEFFHFRDDGRLDVRTLEDGPSGEAKHVADVGDWIIRGVAGEFYPCKPDIFERTYDAV